MTTLPRFEFVGTQPDDEIKDQLMKLETMGHEFPLAEADDELTGLFPCQILLKRIEGYKLPFSFTNKFIIASGLLGLLDTPGNVMILLRYALQDYSDSEQKYGGFDYKRFKHMFKTIPTKEELHTYWDLQKVTSDEHHSFSDNLVDDVRLWQKEL